MAPNARLATGSRLAGVALRGNDDGLVGVANVPGHLEAVYQRHDDIVVSAKAKVLCRGDCAGRRGQRGEICGPKAHSAIRSIELRTRIMKRGVFAIRGGVQSI